MLTFALYFGVFLTVLGVFFIILIAFKAKKLAQFEGDARQRYGQKLIALNFAGVGLSLFGIAIVILALFLR